MSVTEPAAVQPDGAPDDVLRVEHIAKRFGAITALRDVSLHLRKGEVLGLIGDNGAGKSTLVKILSGYHRPDSGEISIFGEPVQLNSVIHARSLGIDTVYQDLALVPGLSVFHNLFLKHEHTRLGVLDNGSMRAGARAPRLARRQHPRRQRRGRRRSRAASGRRSRSRARSSRTPRSSCSTSRSRRWAPRRAG